jgi:pyridoxamine 5'-phosphate oxidase
MVLLRGIDHKGLVFFTDQESGKGHELKANPFAAALFHWFKPVHRQVRVTGAVEVVEASLSDAYWQSRPPGSRRSAFASHQSRVIPSRAALDEEVAELAEAFPDGSGPPRPVRWGGYRIQPDVVELWEEGAHRLHDRLRYRFQSGNWRIERLSP